jgi:hypothetical protein
VNGSAFPAKSRTRNACCLYPIRKACPVCGKPMKVVPEDQMGRERYVCTRCEHKPLHDPPSANGPTAR